MNTLPVAGTLVASGRGAGRSGPTIYDIARAVGVAPSTVSRALNKPERVSSVTLELVRQAAAELKHEANPLARALSAGQAGTLGLILADISNPSLSDVVRGVEAEASARDCKLVLAEAIEGDDAEVAAAQRLLASVDGLLLTGPRMDAAHIRQLAAVKPVVVIDRSVDGVPCVVSDARPGIRKAVRSLAAGGHRRLLYVSGPSDCWMSGSRWESFQDACAWRQLDCVALEGTIPTVEGGRKVARTVLASGATAVLAYNDLVAIGLMQELQAAGIGIPDDISIVGFDDISGANFTTPRLSTIRSPLYSCAAAAASRLLDLLHDGVGPGTESLELGTEFIIRGSCGRLDGPFSD